ncbi:MAG TPA: phosphoribosyl-ATP diphosphatase [Magnetospirillaceae bacterium]|nr:phosphoribosyl-ATP diphosphatase [Magnetospirillaceae bacterium]
MAKQESGAPTTLDRLFARIEASRDGDPAKSYTAKLFSRGRAKIAQKLGEEAVEAVIELLREDKPALIAESADLVYHLLVAWSAAGIRPEEVWAELARREGIGGLAEKASRKSG